MKRVFLATILTICLLLTGTNVFFAEELTNKTENVQLRETLLDKAVEVFPEYEKEIRGEDITFQK